MKNNRIVKALSFAFAFTFATACTTRERDTPQAINQNILEEPVLIESCGLVFSKPLLIEKLCVSEVAVDAACAGSVKAVGSYVAFPNGSDCSTLLEQRDFFPRAVYGGDPDFVAALKSVARLLRKEAKRSSPGFLRLGKRATAELAMRQIATLSSMRLSPIDGFEYEFRFVLPDSRSLISLTMSADGRKFRWVRMVDAG
jgi:hypothetical protein